jgi:hypothetical protein
MSGTFSFEPVGGPEEGTLEWGQTVALALPGWACVAIRAVLAIDQSASNAKVGMHRVLFDGAGAHADIKT